MRTGRTLVIIPLALLLLSSLAGPQSSGLRIWDVKPCDPVISGVTLGTKQDPAVEKQLQEILMEDQRIRMAGGDWQEMAAADTERRREVLALLQGGKVASGKALYAAALVFQHGICPEHYQLANSLAARAMERGEAGARSLYALTLDRYLLSIGKPQKYGTQYRIVGEWLELLPTDPKTTDAERAAYDLPPLEKVRRIKYTPQK